MEQMSFDDALAARDAGIDLVSGHAPNFIDMMRAEARAICERKGEVTSDDLRVYADSIDVEPHSPNVWGAIFREQGWRLVGRRKSELVSNHGREIKVWSWSEHAAA